MTQREAALAGKITPAMIEAAASEGVAPEFIRQGLALGTIAVPANREHRGLKPAAIGAGVRVKINANIGTSPHDVSLEKEQAKLAAALEYGADAVMDLSTGGNLDEIRAALLARCPAPFGTVPIYQVMTQAASLDDVKAANIGTSPHDVNLEKELAKLAAALEYGADAVMDLSTGGPLDEIRTALLASCPAPFGTVPIYQVMTEAKSLDEVKAD